MRPSAPSIRPERSAAIRWPWPPESPHSAIFRNTLPRSIANSKPPPRPLPRALPPRPPGRRSAHHEPRRRHVDMVLHPDQVTNYAKPPSPTRPPSAASTRHARAGVWLPPSQFEAAFLGTAHGEAEIAATIAAAREAFRPFSPYPNRISIAAAMPTRPASQSGAYSCKRASDTRQRPPTGPDSRRVPMAAVVQHDVRGAAAMLQAGRSAP